MTPVQAEDFRFARQSERGQVGAHVEGVTLSADTDGGPRRTDGALVLELPVAAVGGIELSQNGAIDAIADTRRVVPLQIGEHPILSGKTRAVIIPAQAALPGALVLNADDQIRLADLGARLKDPEYADAG